MRQTWVGMGSSSSYSSRFHSSMYLLKSFQLTRSPRLKHRLTGVSDSRRRDLFEYVNQESAESPLIIGEVVLENDACSTSCLPRRFREVL